MKLHDRLLFLLGNEPFCDAPARRAALAREVCLSLRRSRLRRNMASQDSGNDFRDVLPGWRRNAPS